MTHPLDKAIQITLNTDPYLTSRDAANHTYLLSYLAFQMNPIEYGMGQYCRQRNGNQRLRTALTEVAVACHQWLHNQATGNAEQRLRDDYDQQKLAWNGPKNLDHTDLSDKTRYLRMIAQLGKIAYTLDDDQVVTADTVAPEIARLGAYALAWLTHELNQEQK